MMKLTDIYKSLFENDYDDYNKEIDYIERRADVRTNRLRNDYNDYMIYLTKRYGTSADLGKLEKFLDKDTHTRGAANAIRKDWWDAYAKFSTKFTPDEEAKLQKLSRLYIHGPLKFGKYDSMMKSKIYSKYDDPSGLSGDIKSKYVYHLTTEDNLIDILDSNMLYSNSDSLGVSTSSNKNLIKRNPIFYYPSEYTQGTTYRNISAQIVLDLQKIRKDGYKIRSGNDDDTGTTEGEEEVIISGELNNLDLYIVKIVLFKNNIKNLDIIIDELKSRGIKYYINSTYDSAR